MATRFPQNRGGQWGGIIGIVMLAVIVIGLFFVLRGIFNLLYFLAPLLLIATLIVDYKVVINYIKQLGGLFKRNPLYGLGATAFTFFLYPIVFTVLLIRALTTRKIAKFTKGDESEDFVDYEEIDDEPLDLDEFGKIKEKRYDDLFRDERG